MNSVLEVIVDLGSATLRAHSSYQIFTSVTETMSWGETPTLPWVLPAYEKMRVGLEARINDTAFDPALREACAAGHKKLMQYYDIAKASNHTILATGKVYFVLYLSL